MCIRDRALLAPVAVDGRPESCRPQGAALRRNPVSAEEKPMEREWTEREKLLAACAVSHIPPPTGKPMDTPMTPEELAGATWDGHQNRRVVHVEKFSALIAQRDALLVAEGERRIASVSYTHLRAHET